MKTLFKYEKEVKGLPKFCEEPCFGADRVYNKTE